MFYPRCGAVLLVAAIVEALAGGVILPSRVRYIVFIGLVVAAVVLMVLPGRGAPERESDFVVDGPGLVPVAVARNSTEAEIIRGMLRAHGVPCHVRQTDFGAASMDGMPGWAQQVLVREGDAAEARELLAKAH